MICPIRKRYWCRQQKFEWCQYQANKLVAYKLKIVIKSTAIHFMAVEMIYINN